LLVSAFGQDDDGRHALTGSYAVEACEPCDGFVQLDRPLREMDKVHITLIELPDYYGSCNGAPPFEFNLRWGTSYPVPYFYNNLDAYHDAVCDGEFVLTRDTAKLVSESGLHVDLSRASGQQFRLEWVEPRYSVKGTLLLRRLQD
jgi:hypothetical protein